MITERLKGGLVVGALFCVVLHAIALGQTRTPEHALKVGIVADRHGFTEGGCELLNPADTYQSERNEHQRPIHEPEARSVREAEEEAKKGRPLSILVQWRRR